MAPPDPPRRVDILLTASREHRIVPVTFTASISAIAALLTVRHAGEAAGDGRVVDQRAYGPKLAFGGLKEAQNVGLVRNVGLDRNRLRPQAGQMIHHALGRGPISRVIHHDTVSVRRQKLRNLRANPAASACDNCGPLVRLTHTPRIVDTSL